MLPATIVLSRQHSTPSEWPLYRAYGAFPKSEEAAAYSINTPSNILLLMRGRCCDQARDGEQEGKHD